MNFTDLSNKEQEKIMISEIIRNLKKLGGYATKRELLDAIKKGENTIDENFLWINTMQNMVFLLQLLIFQEVLLKQLVKGLESLL